MRTRPHISPDLRRANFFALCDLAEVAPDTKRTPAELVMRLRERGRAHWSEEEVDRAVREYEETL